MVKSVRENAIYFNSNIYVLYLRLVCYYDYNKMRIYENATMLWYSLQAFTEKYEKRIKLKIENRKTDEEMEGNMYNKDISCTFIFIKRKYYTKWCIQFFIFTIERKTKINRERNLLFTDFFHLKTWENVEIF